MADEENKDIIKDEENKDPEQKKEKQLDPVPYDRFKEVNDKKTELEAELQKIKDKQKRDADQKLADDNQWKTLAEQKENELKVKDAELLRLRVANKKRIPEEFVDRLKGETLDEIEADADKILEFIKPDESQGVPPHGKKWKNTLLDIKAMSPKEIREHASEIISQGNQS